MSKSYVDHLAADQRLEMLKLMLEQAGHGNDRVLESGLRRRGLGAGLEPSSVRALLRDLEARDLVTIELVDSTVMVAHITPRGRLVVAGDLEVDGVASPHNGL